ncbi:uncharacterized protein AMSG_05362 [Thecamonas trahens ATCC 50062]|uniref:N-acetyltransferase domain-containing protein n=1 Tax=Thecamonas trahens ATCC 50062 TaxID=461836 RepID=A0A0L0DAH5_THETB|nr:hypothetical protein AMSG_05362 [Thecamonas trahens ATCC 50062]KNC49364.1 hypothetical protein AMSG_05362 [Thecamonas trahens ATCC 50062]|eukprot:XP_013757789.1 hypothetical protein AMSG_05362 [Thecamonas trahens ATCC 50062]
MQVLSKATQVSLSAGQVITSPVDVVRELVENALDAGASAITVRIGPDFASISVTDDGSGIPPDSRSLVGLRYTTSKITDYADLANVASLGFRGEAVNSMATLGKVEITTKCADEDMGTVLVLDSGGAVASSKPAAFPTSSGTQVAVSNLFASYPVRKRVMKQRRKAYNKYIHALISAHAMARPDVRWHYTSSPASASRALASLNAPASSSVADAIGRILGPALGKGLVHIVWPPPPSEPSDAASPDLSLELYVPNPDASPAAIKALTRSSSDKVFMYCNLRPFDSPTLLKLLASAYRTFFDGRVSSSAFPVALVFVSVARSALDINVTPDKRTVMFHAADAVTSALDAALDTVYTRSIIDVLTSQPTPLDSVAAPARRHDPAPSSRPPPHELPPPTRQTQITLSPALPPISSPESLKRKRTEAEPAPSSAAAPARVPEPVTVTNCDAIVDDDDAPLAKRPRPLAHPPAESPAPAAPTRSSSGDEPAPPAPAPTQPTQAVTQFEPMDIAPADNGPSADDGEELIDVLISFERMFTPSVPSPDRSLLFTSSAPQLVGTFSGNDGGAFAIVAAFPALYAISIKAWMEETLLAKLLETFALPPSPLPLPVVVSDPTTLGGERNFAAVIAATSTPLLAKCGFDVKSGSTNGKASLQVAGIATQLIPEYGLVHLREIAESLVAADDDGIALADLSPSAIRPRAVVAFLRTEAARMAAAQLASDSTAMDLVEPSARASMLAPHLALAWIRKLEASPTSSPKRKLPIRRLYSFDRLPELSSQVIAAMTNPLRAVHARELPPYTVGRKNMDITIADSSVSRMHGRLVLEVPGKSCDGPGRRPGGDSGTTSSSSTSVALPRGSLATISFHDASRFGSLHNDRKMTQGETVRLSSGSILGLGLNGSTATLRYNAMVIATSSLPSEKRAGLGPLLRQLDAGFTPVWSSSVTHLVMESIVVTQKVVLALVYGVPIVTPDFLEALVASASAGRSELPSPAEYMPRVVDDMVDMSVASFDPRPLRRSLFAGLTFVFFAANESDPSREVIEAAGGSCILAAAPTKAVVATHGADARFVANMDDPDEPQAAALASAMAAALGPHPPRIVHVSEIALAILATSTERYCNPWMTVEGVPLPRSDSTAQASRKRKTSPDASTEAAQPSAKKAKTKAAPSARSKPKKRRGLLAVDVPLVPDTPISRGLGGAEARAAPTGVVPETPLGVPLSAPSPAAAPTSSTGGGSAVRAPARQGAPLAATTAAAATPLSPSLARAATAAATAGASHSGSASQTADDGIEWISTRTMSPPARPAKPKKMAGAATPAPPAESLVPKMMALVDSAKISRGKRSKGRGKHSKVLDDLDDLGVVKGDVHELTPLDDRTFDAEHATLIVEMAPLVVAPDAATRPSGWYAEAPLVTPARPPASAAAAATVISASDLEPQLATNWHGSVGSVLTRNKLRLVVESSESLARLGEEAVTTLPTLEHLAREAFVEDDFDGELHAISLRASDENDKIVALLFWRGVPVDEMREWIAAAQAIESRLSVAPIGLPTTPQLALGSGGERGELAMVPLRVVSDGQVAFADGAVAPAAWGDSPFDGWMKIEIMGTRPGYGRKGYGRLLLATALFMAAVRDGRRHAVLQVAGGVDNVGAQRLYASFGFEKPPDGVFAYPNDSILVLYDIPGALRAMASASGAMRSRLSEPESHRITEGKDEQVGKE